MEIIVREEEDGKYRSAVDGQRVAWGIDPVKNKGPLPPVSGMGSGKGKGWALRFLYAFSNLKNDASSLVRPLIRHSNRGYPADNLWLLTPFQTFTSPPKLLWLRFVREGGEGGNETNEISPHQ